MMTTYQRENAVAYAHQWAFRRNRAYYNFDELGGDCTNFCSQCLYAGGGVMNYNRDTGWYYVSLGNRSAGWSGVEFLHKFLTDNRKVGPYASPLPLGHAQPGDVVQLSFDGTSYSHSLFVVSTRPEILVATHTIDSDNMALSSYAYQQARLLHIEGVRV